MLEFLQELGPFNQTGVKGLQQALIKLGTRLLQTKPRLLVKNHLVDRHLSDTMFCMRHDTQHNDIQYNYT